MTHDEEQAVIRAHDGRIRVAALPFLRLGASMDDLIQEGRIALLLAMRKWQPDRGATIWTYARRFVIGAMFSTVGQILSAPMPMSPEAIEDIPDAAPLSTEERIVLLDLLERLSPRELQVIRHVLMGETLSEVAAGLDICESSAHGIRNAALTKMRKVA